MALTNESPRYQGDCRWKFLNGLVSITEGPPLSADPGIRKYRRWLRRSSRVALVSAVLNVGLSIYWLAHFLW
jgi:hypothetical protein